MCDPVTATVFSLASGVGMSFLQNKNNKKAKAQTNAQINAINKKVDDHIEANKIANSVQSTDTTKETPIDLATKLKQQKVPLNTTNTGATIGTPTSVGLNLGGY